MAGCLALLSQHRNHLLRLVSTATTCSSFRSCATTCWGWGWGRWFRYPEAHVTELRGNVSAARGRAATSSVSVYEGELIVGDERVRASASRRRRKRERRGHPVRGGVRGCVDAKEIIARVRTRVIPSFRTTPPPHAGAPSAAGA